jgi:hypothetical protein
VEGIKTNCPWWRKNNPTSWGIFWGYVDKKPKRRQEMKYFSFLVLALAVSLLALSFRYRMEAVPRADDHGFVYVIDNWTGRVWACAVRACVPAEVK